MNFDQLAEHKNSEYASLLEPVSDQSMEEGNEPLDSARAQLSRLERELETQLQDDREYNHKNSVQHDKVVISILYLRQAHLRIHLHIHLHIHLDRKRCHLRIPERCWVAGVSQLEQ
jgi:hypothetical protein